MPRLVGGPALRRGRRPPTQLRSGDALDFWRVTGLEPGRRLELRAEMRLPGIAVLEFAAEDHQKPARNRLRMTWLLDTTPAPPDPNTPHKPASA